MLRYSTFFLLFCVLAVVNFANGDDNNKELKKDSVHSGRRWAPVLSTVNCYTCAGCSDVNKATLLKVCPYSTDTLRVTKCVKYAEIIHNNIKGQNVSWVVRGCGTEKGTCDEIRQTYSMNPEISLDYCMECEGDNCNSASRSASELFLAFFTVMVIPIFVKYALS